MALWLQILIGWFIFSFLFALWLGRVFKRGIEEGEKKMNEPVHYSEEDIKKMFR
jgi:hypothetical protein